MNTLDIIVFFVYIGGIALFGGSFFKKNKTSSSYTLGNKDIPSWVVTMSIFATFVSSISYSHANCCKVFCALVQKNQ